MMYRIFGCFGCNVTAFQIPKIPPFLLQLLLIVKKVDFGLKKNID